VRASNSLLLKLMITLIVTKCPAFYASRKLITVRTAARERSISWASWKQSTSSHAVFVFRIRVNIMHLYAFVSAIHATCLAHFILIDFISLIILGKEYKLELYLYEWKILE
jgi:hypothetical protein